eukprot:2765122-Prymnesium_polylepis.2
MEAPCNVHARPHVHGRLVVGVAHLDVCVRSRRFQLQCCPRRWPEACCQPSGLAGALHNSMSDGAGESRARDCACPLSQRTSSCAPSPVSPAPRSHVAASGSILVIQQSSYAQSCAHAARASAGVCEPSAAKRKAFACAAATNAVAAGATAAVTLPTVVSAPTTPCTSTPCSLWCCTTERSSSCRSSVAGLPTHMRPYLARVRATQTRCGDAMKRRLPSELRTNEMIMKSRSSPWYESTVWTSNPLSPTRAASRAMWCTCAP